MADGTKIEWTDATWNPITGCSIVSPGCANCYAMKLAGTRLAHIPSRAGLTTMTKAGPVWNGQVRFNEGWLDQPLRWKRPRRIFVCAHGDLFAEGVPDEWIDKVCAVMALCPQHTFQVLTKRAARMRDYFCKDARWRNRQIVVARNQIAGVKVDFGPIPSVLPLPNVWLGVSTERQPEADERIPDLLRTPGAVRFISAEPLLGPIQLNRLMVAENVERHDGPWSLRWDALSGFRATSPYSGTENNPHLDWVISGGESGPGARPSNPQWFRDIRDQCRAAGVAYFHKQNGEWVSVSEVEGEGEHFTFADGRTVRHVGKKKAGRLLEGVEHNGMPRPAA